MPSFASSLNRAAEEIKRPPPLPVGTYLFRVTKSPDVPREIESKKTGEKYEVLSVPVQVVSVFEADQDEIDAYGKVAGQPSRKEFMFSTSDDVAHDRTLADLKRFCEHCGIDVETGTPQLWLSQLPNTTFLGDITHRPDPNDASGETVFSQLGRTAPAS